MLNTCLHQRIPAVVADREKPNPKFLFSTPPSSCSERALDIWTFAFTILFVGAAGVMVGTFLDYGLTWDEESQHIYGQYVLRWYQTRGRDDSALTFENLMYYGAFFEIVAEIAARWSPWGTYEGRHFVNVVFALSAVVGTYKLGRLVGTPRAGFLSALFLLTIPEFYGHSFNNPKDIPLAALSVWALVAILRGTRTIPRVGWREIAWTGLALGLLLAVRVGAVFYFGYVVIAWTGALALKCWTIGTTKRELIDHAARLSVALALVIVGAWTIMLMFWPYGQIKPIEHPIRAIFEAAHFPWNASVRFQGADILASELPRTYIPIQIAIKLPEYLYFVFACGVVAMITALRNASTVLSRTAADVTMLVLAVLFPIGVASLLGATVYDGMRHFIFVLPPLAVLGGVGLSEFLHRWSGRSIRVGVGVVVALGLAYVIIDMIALHPYQSVYFNHALVGGLPGARGRFETDYWGNSYREAVEWVLRNYHWSGTTPLVVKNCSSDFLTSYFIAKHPDMSTQFTNGRANQPPDIFLATERWNCHEQPSGELLHIVERKDAPLAYVFKMTTSETDKSSAAISKERP